MIGWHKFSEFENFRKIFCPWKFFFSANGPIQFRLENFTAFSEDSDYFFTYCTGVEKIGEHCSQEMFNSCREFIWMKICYWKCEGNLNTHVPLWAQQHMVDRHYSLNLKPWSARTLYVYAHADLAQEYSVGLQEIFVSSLCSQEGNYFFLPWYCILTNFDLHHHIYSDAFIFMIRSIYHILADLMWLTQQLNSVAQWSEHCAHQNCRFLSAGLKLHIFAPAPGYVGIKLQGLN